MSQAGLRHQGGRQVLRVSFICKRTAAHVRHSPGLTRNFKHDDVAAVENGNDDHEHQEEEADEKHDGLNGHPCGKGRGKKGVHTSYLLSKLTATVVLDANVSCTEADDSSLISRQAHPTDDTRFRRTDGLLAVINTVNISFVQPLQV